MKLEQCTWQEVEAYLRISTGILIPTGSTEQHGPIGLIGTDSICSERIALDAAARTGTLVAPPIVYTPAPFNLAFPGTVSVPEELFRELVHCIIESLGHQGFIHFFFVNGHGANLAPLREIEAWTNESRVRVRSWWDYPEVSELRTALFGKWEGMHATPSEISITQFENRIVISEEADQPPELLSKEFMKDAAGDKHGPPDEHRARFPDGRVGSHSAMARPEHGRLLLEAAGKAVARDFSDFIAT